MRALIDAYWLVDGPPSGMGVLRNMLRAWNQSFPEDELVLVVPVSKVDAAQRLGFRAVVIPSRFRLHPLINWTTVARLDARDEFYIVLAHNFAVPRPGSTVLLHDVIFQSNPEWFTRAERLYLALATWSSRWARTVVTSSNTEATRIKALNRHIGDVTPIGLGFSTAFLPEAPSESRPELTEDSYLLAVGRLNVRKNLGRIIEGALRSGLLSDAFPLVIVGETSGKDVRLTDEARSAAARGEIIFLGFTPDPQLKWLYEHCRLMVFLSLDEGYGLPPLEAATLGSRVLASDIAVMHEILGSHATFVDPTDTTAIARTLKAVAAAPHAPATNAGPPPGAKPWSDVVSRLREGARRNG